MFVTRRGNPLVNGVGDLVPQLGLVKL